MYAMFVKLRMSAYIVKHVAQWGSAKESFGITLI